MAETKKIKWSKLILVISLGLNLVVVGLVAGAWVNGPKRGERGGAQPSWASGPFGRSLSEEDRRAMGNEFRKNPELREKLGEQRREMRQIGLEIAEALRADPYQPAVLEGLFAQQTALGVELSNVGNQALMDRITVMTPAQRAEFAERLEKAMKRGRNRSRERSKD